MFKPVEDAPIYRPGLIGVWAAQTELSRIDGIAGRLVFRGYDALKLASERSFEEIVHLLWLGRLPDASEANEFGAQLASLRTLPDVMRRAIENMPPATPPSRALMAAMAALSSDEAWAVDVSNAMRILAVTPTAIAAHHNIRRGLSPVEPLPSLDHAANYLYMLSGELPTPERAKGLSTYLLLLSEHALNASTFTARVAASTESDLVSAITAAIAVHRGGLHGGALQRVIEQLEEAKHASNLDSWILDVLQRGERFMGFGHPVYRTTDPRSELFKELASEQGWSDLSHAESVERAVHTALRKCSPSRPMPTNVEFYSAGLLRAVGIPTDLLVPTFASARMTGWLGHAMEQVAQQKAGNSCVIHPESEYVGPEPGSGLPVDEKGH